MSSLFCFGFGYSAQALAERAQTWGGWTVQGTSTTLAGARKIAALGHRSFVVDGEVYTPGIVGALMRATHVLVSAPPGPGGDPILGQFDWVLANCPSITWIGYLSTIGVYGDWSGAWVDERCELRPQSERSRRRTEAEAAWQAMGRKSGKRVLIFRLAGIYGPGRSAIDTVLDGSARRIVKPGQVFNRIHRDDIAGALEASIQGTPRHSIYNVTDDQPAPAQDVVAYAAELLGRPVPPELPFEAAALTPMGASFYAENKRASNARAKDDLNWRLRYPTYREGLAAIAAKVAAKTG